MSFSGLPQLRRENASRQQGCVTQLSCHLGFPECLAKLAYQRHCGKWMGQLRLRHSACSMPWRIYEYILIMSCLEQTSAVNSTVVFSPRSCRRQPDVTGVSVWSPVLPGIQLRYPVDWILLYTPGWMVNFLLLCHNPGVRRTDWIYLIAKLPLRGIF